MAYDDGAAPMISRQDQHFIRRCSRVEGRRYIGEDAWRGYASPLQGGFRGAEDSPVFPVSHRHPTALLPPQVGFEPLFALGTFGAAEFQQLRRNMRCDVREMQFGSIVASGQPAHVPQHAF